MKMSLLYLLWFRGVAATAVSVPQHAERSEGLLSLQVNRRWNVPLLLNTIKHRPITYIVMMSSFRIQPSMNIAILIKVSSYAITKRCHSTVIQKHITSGGKGTAYTRPVARVQPSAPLLVRIHCETRWRGAQAGEGRPMQCTVKRHRGQGQGE